MLNVWLSPTYPKVAAYAAFFVIVTFLAPAESMGSLAHKLQIRRAAQARTGDVDIARTLYILRYTLSMNLAGFTAFGITAWAIHMMSGNLVRAYQLVIMIGMGVDAVATASAYVTHRILERQMRTQGASILSSRRRSGWTMNRRKEWQHPADFDPCRRAAT